ncbi:MAG: methyltransferase domain-containing protein [Acidobacteriia bacterium]|nr:methyltransferase domain-containing protein [Terriglobia bacterium]
MMSLLRPKRIRHEEMLDADLGTPQEVEQSLKDLRRINRYLNGYRSSLRPIQIHVRRHSLPRFSLLDVATGSADFPLAAARWARSAGVQSTIVGLDYNRRHLDFARTDLNQFPEVRLVTADFRHVPFRPASFDFVNASMFLHHLRDEEVSGFLNTLFSIARVGVIINDLERHWIPYLFLKLVQPIFARGRITRFDAFTSLRQGFTSQELQAFARASGFGNFWVKKFAPYRWTLWISKNGTARESHP